MYKRHKILSTSVFLLISVLSYWLNAAITNTVSQNLVTFFSIVFGFNMTCIAIIHGTKYSKKIYKEIDPINKNQRYIHRISKYFILDGYWSILSASAVIVYSAISRSDDNDVLLLGIGMLQILTISLDINLLITSLIFGISSVNVMITLFLLHETINSIIHEAKPEI